MAQLALDLDVETEERFFIVSIQFKWKLQDIFKTFIHELNNHKH